MNRLLSAFSAPSLGSPEGESTCPVFFCTCYGLIISRTNHAARLSFPFGIICSARSAAHSVLSHPLAQPLLKSMPPPTIAHLTNISGELSLSSTSTSSTTSLQERAGVGEFDSARIYLAKWARVVAVEGEKARKAEVLLSGPEGRIETEVGAFEVLSVRTFLSFFLFEKLLLT